MRSSLIALMAVLLGAIPSAGSTHADSINLRAQDPDFIQVSLITLGPGDEIYSLYGHSAIRMACPDQHLDFCFTFEMAITPEEELKFLLSTAKAGFIAAATPSFFDNYRREGRSIREHQLNLTPQEEQKLWQMLDREMQQGAHWDYSFLTTNCSSMCVWIVEEALWASGERIDYGQLPQAVTGTYRDLLDELSADYPWARLFWNLRMGSKGEERGELRDKLAPALLEQAWQQAVITDKEGHSRPMVVGDSVQHAEQTFRPKSALITPMGVTAAMLIFILLTIIMFILKKRKR